MHAYVHNKGLFTDRFDIEKGIKQGCPLAPLLFVVVMDSLLVKLSTMRGYRLTLKDSITSKAYADDLVTCSGSVDDLMKMHKWVETFLNYHFMTLSTTKTIAIGRFNNGF